MRDEIPQWCWYNGQILFALSDNLETNPKQSIEDFISAFKSERGLTTLNLKNQGLLISLLYGLFVVPKEMWEPGKSKTSFVFATRNGFKMSQPGDVTTEGFLRRLRNSIAHANFEIVPETNLYKFWNIDRKGVKDFEVEIAHGDLGMFISEVGKYFINEVRQRTGAL